MLSKVLNLCLSRLINDNQVYNYDRRRHVGANIENTEGFYESELLVDINTRLLSIINSSWSRPLLCQVRWGCEALLPYLIEQREALREFSKEPWIDKDPRLCLVWGAYKHIFLKEPTGIAIVRNPLDVARSLHLRNGFRLEKGLLIWWLYNFHLMRQSNDNSILIISDDQIMSKDALALHTISEFLYYNGWKVYDLESLTTVLTACVNEVCNPDLRRASNPKITTRNGLVNEVMNIWTQWREEEHSQLSIRKMFDNIPMAVIDEYAKNLEEQESNTQHFTDLYLERLGLSTDGQIHRVHQKLHDTTERLNKAESSLMYCEEKALFYGHQIEMMKNSTSWIITAPIRLIGNILLRIKLLLGGDE